MRCWQFLLFVVQLCAKICASAPNCPPGKYLLTASSCVSCPRNSWNDLYNQTQCLLCPVNQYNSTVGLSSNGCKQCAANFVSVSGGDCTCPSPDHRLVGSECKRWGTECNYGTHYRNSAGGCTAALKYCASGDTCCSQGFSIKRTATSDAVCYGNGNLLLIDILTNTYQCADQFYMVRKLVLDIDNLVVQTAICRRWEDCNYATQYQLRAPSPTSNRLCVYLSICNSVTEYERVAKTTTSDRVCTVKTVCDGDSQYLLVMGSGTTDNTCVTATPCYQPSLSRVHTSYTKIAAVNAPSESVNGKYF